MCRRRWDTVPKGNIVYWPLWICLFEFSNTNKVIKSVLSKSTNFPSVSSMSPMVPVMPDRAVYQVAGWINSLFWTLEEPCTSRCPEVTAWFWYVPSTVPRKQCYSHTPMGCHGGAASSALRGAQTETLSLKLNQCTPLFLWKMEQARGRTVGSLTRHMWEHVAIRCLQAVSTESYLR